MGHAAPLVLGGALVVVGWAIARYRPQDRLMTIFTFGVGTGMTAGSLLAWLLR